MPTATAPSPSNTGRRAARTRPPEPGNTVTADCGCTGVVRETRGGQFPIVSVIVAAPCPSGHPSRIGAGVTERFFPEQVRAVAT